MATKAKASTTKRPFKKKFKEISKAIDKSSPSIDKTGADAITASMYRKKIGQKALTELATEGKKKAKAKKKK
jgi:hypothetical protein